MMPKLILITCPLGALSPWLLYPWQDHKVPPATARERFKSMPHNSKMLCMHFRTVALKSQWRHDFISCTDGELFSMFFFTAHGPFEGFQ